MAAASLNSSRLFQSNAGNDSAECRSFVRSTANRSFKLKPITAALTAAPTVGISETFSKLKKQGKVALIPYITAGDPNLSTTAEALKVLDSCGSDIIELGVPYSDPLADGPVIQAAATRALAKGTNFDSIIAMLQEVSGTSIILSSIIVLILQPNTQTWCGAIHDHFEGYWNTCFSIAVNVFYYYATTFYLISSRISFISGLVVPDVPLEETDTLRKEAAEKNIELVLLTTPTTPRERMQDIVEASEGFVYLVSSVGVTGARGSVNNKVQSLLLDIKETTNKPVVVGFGISEPHHVKQVADWGADGVIVGSAMVRILGDAKSPEEGLKELEVFTKSLKSALE
ncbi:hypothetical protein SASPL_103208 [Salvia splendens]|uniref:tryptophan synthase n=1 Tax=Salvia splendens TaxID=180675 RepID=A0A8X8YXG5_SALSN|nr:hypothetical protein SASPL_103208 [Salvia splendens]